MYIHICVASAETSLIRKDTSRTVKDGNTGGIL